MVEIGVPASRDVRHRDITGGANRRGGRGEIVGIGSRQRGDVDQRALRQEIAQRVQVPGIARSHLDAGGRGQLRHLLAGGRGHAGVRARRFSIRSLARRTAVLASAA